MEQTNPNPKKKSPTPINYAKYAGMGLQMAAIMGIGTYAGVRLDDYIGFKKFPVFTLLFSLVSVFGAIYYFIKDFLKK
ncbi:MAG: AtpZ/AtpI family protein [Bacteroidia bacterium]|nr:AtpZ/AtpI family protein [Bacteroidia bacterium]